MPIVNWNNILPRNVNFTISYSSLSIPANQDSLDVDIAEIVLDDNIVVDVEWDDQEQRYYVTMFRDDYDNQILQRVVKSASEVVDVVREMVEAPFSSSASSDDTLVEQLVPENA